MSIPYQLVIFDFDGTLADSFPWFQRTFNDVAERFDFRRLEAAELEALRTKSSREIVAHLGVPFWKLPLIARHMRREMAREIDQIGLFPGVDALLPRLSTQGIRLGLVTSNSAANARRVLGPNNAALFQHYGCSVGVLGKRAALRRVVRESGVPRERVLSIGDELRDLEASRAEQLTFGAVTWGYTAADVLAQHRPDELFHTIEEMAERLTAAGSGRNRE